MKVKSSKIYAVKIEIRTKRNEVRDFIGWQLDNRIYEEHTLASSPEYFCGIFSHENAEKVLAFLKTLEKKK